MPTKQNSFKERKQSDIRSPPTWLIPLFGNYATLIPSSLFSKARLVTRSIREPNLLVKTLIFWGKIQRDRRERERLGTCRRHAAFGRRRWCRCCRRRNAVARRRKRRCCRCRLASCFVEIYVVISLYFLVICWNIFLVIFVWEKVVTRGTARWLYTSFVVSFLLLLLLFLI